ncbi:hypothetical protein [Pedobacter namyangjuensis]|uniref:hypothetical protein n=1 Tax=Pedobacter namyangjuensis TaxID=600626 RepID=UPI000DE56E0C|nr:hypothetical protein [Pedobacter namyangjuensis]
MENNNKKIGKDLQQFIDKFQPSKFKMLDKGIDIRGVNNLHRDILEAKQIIESLNLNLFVSHNAEMLTYGGFEVNYR